MHDFARVAIISCLLSLAFLPPGRGQLVVPQFDLAVTFMAGNYRQGLWNRERDDITGEMIIPALDRAAASR